ncbi:MAG: hypothetical protein AAGA32_16690 [Pseudomonadota bacterium]
MSISMEGGLKRWAAKLEPASVVQGKTTDAEAGPLIGRRSSSKTSACGLRADALDVRQR